MQTTAAHKKAIDHYYQELETYHDHKVTHETAVRSAFQNLLATFARSANWTLIPEQILENGKRPDGTMRDTFNLPRGYWEAKDTKDDLKTEIRKKITLGYPITNTIFEDTRRAILYQNNKQVLEVDLAKPTELTDVLDQFFSYTEPDIASFEAAVKEFKERVPELAGALLAIIEREYTQNKKFIDAFNAFTELCRASLDPKITADVINEMLIQHLLTERLFSSVFDNPDFIRRNAIAAEVEKVIDALTSRSFNSHEFLKSLDRFYVAIEAAARSIDGWLERQHFLDTVYERFFQGYSVKRADTFGIVYTPQEIVDFMCASVEEVLQREFGTSIAEPGVQIIDPCVGTGSYIVNLLHRIPNSRLKYKYEHDLFCNEIMLLPYYIASLNIEHEYYSRMGEYEPFEGICFTDTLELAESKQISMFVEENTERVQREKDAQIMVVIGNPPYNVGQKSENDNNKNRKYPVIDEHVYGLYVRGSKATNNRALSDAYVKFFRWATDRLQGRDGIVCFVSNNSFIDGLAFDSFRERLAEEFTCVYHIDLGGNARKHGGGNVFGVMVSIGITILVRNRKQVQAPNQPATIFYHKVTENLNRTAKLNFLATNASIHRIEWQALHPNAEHTWLTSGLDNDYSTLLQIGTKEARTSQNPDAAVIFRIYSSGLKTNRDYWTYDFNHFALITKIRLFIDTYNSEVDRWRRRGSDSTKIDDFVTYDDARIKWSESLKLDLQRANYAIFNESKIRVALYRPFCKQWLFFDGTLNERVYQLPKCFPVPATQTENTVLCVAGVGNRKGFGCLAVNAIPNLDLAFEKAQCFPYYTYAEDGTNRRENITDWALSQFQAKYGSEVTKWDIFHYVYAMLHHPQYRERYAENLKRDLPHIPLLYSKEAFLNCVRIGQQLMDIHLHYEQSKEFPLQWVENREVPFSWRVEKMKLTPDKTAVVVNESLTLSGIPQACFQYRLGNRSALDWVIDQYQVSEDKRSGIVSDPNNLDDVEYIVRLVGKVVRVSVETVQLVSELAIAVTQDDWMGDITKEAAGHSMIQTIE